ncbi:hypothetical protein CPB84DRAFT_1777997 [Gymnopilus junonius]|uniref:Uncharacterized protein n=1 Tax=Gymnopilus junonius TaxID=109634 RepID=A0A9P5TMJ4_GYMJU|nr:hypothetical protein CPB84DRAFT_1777997 [Gymnopilus junonius]
MHYYRNPGRTEMSEHQFQQSQSLMLEKIDLWRSARKGSQISLSVSFERSRLNPPIAEWTEHIKALIVDHVEVLHRVELRVPFADGKAFFEIRSERMSRLECLGLFDLAYADFLKLSIYIDGTHPGDTPVIAHHLTDLSITFVTQADPSFFRGISFPKLASLRIGCATLLNHQASFLGEGRTNFLAIAISSANSRH